MDPRTTPAPVGPGGAFVSVLALAWGTLSGWRMPGSRDFVYHLWASWLLLFLFEGKHPTLGYYAYPAALTSIALAMLASRAVAALESRVQASAFVLRRSNAPLRAPSPAGRQSTPFHIPHPAPR